MIQIGIYTFSWDGILPWDGMASSAARFYTDVFLDITDLFVVLSRKKKTEDTTVKAKTVAVAPFTTVK